MSRTFYFDNKQKHQLVLRRTSWCFVLLWPHHVFTKYFARGIRMHQEQPKSYLEPLRTSKTPYIIEKKQKHELVLFALLTIISLRQIFVPESQECTSNNLWSIWGLFQLLFAILGPKTFKIVKSTSWCFVHFWPVHFWTSSVGGSGPEVYDRKIQGGEMNFISLRKLIPKKMHIFTSGNPSLYYWHKSDKSIKQIHTMYYIVN